MLIVVSTFSFAITACRSDPEGSDQVDGPRSASSGLRYTGGGVTVRVEAGSAADESVIADLNQLVPDLSDLVPVTPGAKPEEMIIRFRGKSRAGGPGPAYPEAPAAKEEVAVRDTEPLSATFVAFNPGSGNEFEVQFPRSLLWRLHAGADAAGLNRTVQLEEREKDVAGRDDATGSPSLFSWSGNVDNRVRFYGEDQPVTAWERQRVSDFGGCTVTLVGPRHVVTAAHCVYDASEAEPWVDDVSIRVARNGTSWLDSVLIDNDNIPNGQALWYFVPQGYINTGNEQYDFSVIVTPKRIGETTGGWMGWWALSAATMATQSLWNVGYPGCNAFTSDGTPRIDEPNPCSENHLYGDVNTCSPANFTNLDGDGWNRNFQHRCDASGGQSGSPIYLNYNGQGWGVTGVHTKSLCGAVAGDPCSESEAVRPLRATRITPEYSGWLTYFRNTFP
jgi:V8-like Glu-specific endopeptidase